MSNEPDQEALSITENEEPSNATEKDEILKDAAVEDASVTSNMINPASEEANELNIAKETVVHEVHTTEAPKEDSVSEVMLYSLVLCFFQTKYLYLTWYCIVP